MGIKAIQLGKLVFPTNISVTMGNVAAQNFKMKLNLYLTPHTKMNSKGSKT
jgi:hypothetical protein